MMKGKVKYLAFSTIASAAAVTVLVTTPAQSQLNLKDSVALQAANPGYSQSGNANISGTMRAGQYIGGGSGLTNLSAAALASGTLADARLSSNVAMRNGINSFTSQNSFNGDTFFYGFINVRRSTGPVHSSEAFGIGENSADWEGMYVKTSVAGRPYYGYTAGGETAMTYYDAGLDQWRVMVQNQTPFRVSATGIGLNVDPIVGHVLHIKGRNRIVEETGSTALEINQTGSGGKALEVNTWATGMSFGILGRAGLPTSVGVYGDNTSSGEGIGVWGSGWGTGSTGVYGSAVTYGVDGNSTNGYGVRGRSESSHGVFGTSQLAEAVVGRTYAANKSAVHGYADVAGSHGGFFWSNAGTGTGVGVIGQTSSASGYGVQSIGRFTASGTKSFRIDHPLDPENKFLTHYCAEGPEPLNVYSGETRTGTDGYAWIELPEYFSEINRNPRVQLTVDDMSEDFVMAKVVGGVREGGFRIRTSKPGITVYWEVKAIRNDRFVQAHGAPVETEKSDSERGKYIHPDLYGAPETQGIYAAKAEAVTRIMPESAIKSLRPSMSKSPSRGQAATANHRK